LSEKQLEIGNVQNSAFRTTERTYVRNIFFGYRKYAKATTLNGSKIRFGI